MTSLTDEFRNQTTRAMMNHLCPWLLTRDNTNEVTEAARSQRRAERERLTAQAEDRYRRYFENTFDLDYFEDEVENIEESDDEDDEDDEVNVLSQGLGSQKL